MGMEVNELRTKLVERLVTEAGNVGSAHDGTALAKLVLVHQALQALDVAIAVGVPEAGDGPLAWIPG